MKMIECDTLVVYYDNVVDAILGADKSRQHT